MGRERDSTTRKTQTTSTSSQGEDQLLRKGKRIKKMLTPSLDLDNLKESITSTSIRRPAYESLDKCFVGELGLALTAIIRNHSNPVQLALQQFELVSQSLNTRNKYANQILAETWITPKKEQKIAKSYFDTRIQHARLVSDAYNASHGFVDGKATDCGLTEVTPKAMNEGNSTIGCQKPISEEPSNTSPKSVSEMCHSQETKKKKKRKIKNQENHCHSSIPSQLEMENRSTIASSKEKKINESVKPSRIRTLQDGMTVEVLVKGKPNGKVASLGKQVKVYYIAKLRDTGYPVGSNITDAAPHEFCLGDQKMLQGLNIGLEGMHVGEKRRLVIPPSMGPRSKDKTPIMPDSWILYDVELVDVC